MNPGGIRSDLTFNNQVAGEAPGQITYAEMFTVQPFNNVVNVKTMTGDADQAAARAAVRQSGRRARSGCCRCRPGFTYSYDFRRPAGSRVDAGQRASTACRSRRPRTYRVAMNNFLATGGDGFTVFNEGTDQLGGEIDIDAAVNYFMKNSPIAPGPQNRVTRLG